MRSGLGSTDVHFGITPRDDSPAPARPKRLEECDQNTDKETGTVLRAGPVLVPNRDEMDGIFKVCVVDFACCLRGSHPALLCDASVLCSHILTLHISVLSAAAQG